MTEDRDDTNLLDTAPEAETEMRGGENDQLDEENILKPEFVRAVKDALGAGENDRVYDLVEPLHPADTADLFEHMPPEAFRVLEGALYGFAA